MSPRLSMAAYFLLLTTVWVTAATQSESSSSNMDMNATLPSLPSSETDGSNKAAENSTTVTVENSTNDVDESSATSLETAQVELPPVNEFESTTSLHSNATGSSTGTDTTMTSVSSGGEATAASQLSSAAGDRSTGQVSQQNSNHNDGTYGIALGVVFGVVLAVIMVLFVVRMKQRRQFDKKKQAESLDDTMDPESTRESISGSGTGFKTLTGYSSTYFGSNGRSNSKECLSSIWSDLTIVAARLPYERVIARGMISRGRLFDVYDGLYHSKRVAIKKVTVDRRKQMSVLEDFLLDAKLLTSLRHERIVSFVGLAWDSPKNLCVLVEFMDNGDLRSVLSQWKHRKQRTGWNERKLQIALHIAEALTYLHSKAPEKVIHNNLSSKNILLDGEWNAKVGDVGVTREQPRLKDGILSATGGHSSCLWTAPEVLMGQFPDDRSDIFSFGVVLTELDSHALPYHNVTTIDAKPVPEQEILQMVADGRVQASFSAMSRTDMVLLGRACLSIDPANRPLASEIVYKIRRALQSVKLKA